MSKYIDYNHVLSYNCNFNMITTERSFGKTEGFKLWAFKRFLKYRKPYVFMLRFKDDFQPLFFLNYFHDTKNILENEGLDTSKFEFYIKSKIGYFKPTEYVEFYGNDFEEGVSYPIVYFMALSTWQKTKGIPFGNVDSLCYDEFIKEKDNSRYLADEPRALWNFLDTCFRDKSGWKIFLLGNPSSIYNPYFIEYRMIPEANTQIMRKDGKLLYRKVTDEFIKNRIESQFGKMIAGTEYEQFSTFGKNYMDSYSLIKKQDGKINSRLLMIIKYNNKKYGFWTSDDGHIYINNKVNETLIHKFCLLVDDIEPSYRMMSATHHMKKYLKSMLLENKLHIEYRDIRDEILDILATLKLF